MRQRKWISTAIAAAALSAVPPIARAHDAATPLALSLHQDSVRADLETQGRVLNDPQATPQAREEAARRLVSRPSAEADAILLRALTGGRFDAQLAAATALSADSTPNADFIEPLALLLGRERALTSAAAHALTVFKDSELVRTRMEVFIANARQPLQLRSPVITAMARFGDKKAASAMIRVLTTEESQILRQAADEALSEMTGIRRGQFDVQRWQQWWQANKDKPEPDWARDFSANQGRRLTEAEQQLRALSEAMGLMMAQQFNDLPLDRRGAYLVKHLNDASEHVRAKAANLARQELVLVGRRDPEVFKALRGRIGDSSPEVRSRVIDTLGEWRDPQATQALITQLAQEPDTDMRVTIVNALAKSSDVRAVEPLLDLLDGESFALARAAADALKSREMAGALRDKDNQALFEKVANRLLTRFKRLDRNNAVTREFRESVVEAMASLGHEVFQRDFIDLLGGGQVESEGVRIAALRGLALVGRPESANFIAGALRDPVAGVRLVACVSLRATGAFEHADLLVPRVIEDNDADVRAAAWQTLLILLPKAPQPENLAIFAEAFNPRSPTAIDVERRQKVLEVQEQLYESLAPRNADAAKKLAANRETQAEQLLIGDAKRNEVKLGRPRDAAAKYRQALDYWNSVPANDADRDPLRNGLMRALLQAKEYTTARDFARELLSVNKAHADSLWTGAIAKELRRLHDAKDYDTGLEMIKALMGVDDMPAELAQRLRRMQDEFNNGRSGGFRIYVHFSDEAMDVIALPSVLDRLA